MIRLDFLFSTGYPVFVTRIFGDDPLKQREFLEALLRVDKIYIFVTNSRFRLIKVKELPFNATEHPEINQLLGK